MATIKSQIYLVDQMSAPLKGIIGSMNAMLDVVKSADKTISKSFDSSKIQAMENQIQQASKAMASVSENIQNAQNKQQKFNQQVQNGTGAIDGLANKFMGLAGAYVGIQGLKKAIDLSDTLNQNKARLELVNDGLQSTEVLQKKIYQAAQRSRGAYLEIADSVAKLRLQAKDAFSSNDQAIKFAENINKVFTISGTSAEGMSSTMYNLTQALSSGVLRGQDFNIVMQNAPMILEKVAEKMGVPMGQLRELASQGKLSAQLVKQSILDATDDIDAKFRQMPMTWSALWTTVSNELIIAFQPLLDILGQGASFIVENWSMIEPIFWGLVVAVGAFALGTMIMNGTIWGAVVATYAWTTALLSNPLFWIALVIGVVIMAIIRWVQSVGGLKVAWLICMSAIKSAFDAVKIGVTTGVFWVMNMFNKLQLGASKLSAGMANAFGSIKVKVLTVLQEMVNGAIDTINKLINAVNKIPGVAISPIEHVSFATAAAIQFEADKQARENAVSEMENDVNSKIQSRNDILASMKAQAQADKQARLDNIQALQIANTGGGGALPLDYSGGGSGAIPETGGGDKGGSGIGKDVSDIKDAVTKSEEDLKYLRDIAEREVINRFTTAEINLDMGGITQNVSSNMDLDGIISYLEDGLYESMQMAAEGV